FADFVSRVQANVIPFVVGNVGSHNPFLVPISKRRIKGRAVVTATEAYFMVLPPGVVVKNGCLPVRSFTQRLRIGINGISSRSNSRFVSQGGILRGIEEAELPGRGRSAV